MNPMRPEIESNLAEDLVTWYAESNPGDALYIALPPHEWYLRLTRQRCWVTWRPPGQPCDVPVWLDQIVSWLMKIVAHETEDRSREGLVR